MSTIKLIPGQAGVLMSSQAVRDFLGDLADRAASHAQSTAPHQSGAYSNSISGSVEQIGDRVVGIVSSSSPYARKIEAATGNLARSLGEIHA